MSIQIIINGENAEHALLELSAFSAGLTGGQTVAPAVAEAPKATRTRSTTKPETVKAEPEKQPEPEPETEPEPEDDGSEPSDSDAPIPSVVELRAKAQEVGAAKGKPAIKATLEQFGSASITDIPEEKRAAFLAALEAL